MTRLEWSAAIGKRVHAGTWADQAVPTLDSARAALAEAGDTFGLKAGRREVAAQLVDSFMEEAKVVHVIYKVWTAGFLDWLAANGVTEAERAAELDRLARLLAWPDGTPHDPVARLGRFTERAERPADVGAPRRAGGLACAITSRRSSPSASGPMRRCRAS